MQVQPAVCAETTTADQLDEAPYPEGHIDLKGKYVKAQKMGCLFSGWYCYKYNNIHPLSQPIEMYYSILGYISLNPT